MYEIVSNLYLCSYTDAQHGVKRYPNAYIVNCTKDLPMLSKVGQRVAVDDDKNQESILGMAAMLESVTKEMHRQLTEANRVVIVHCLAGQQRSPTVIAAYLMRYHGCTQEDAILYVRARKRDAFFWSVNFERALEVWSERLKSL